MKLIVQPITQPAPDQVLLPILFTELAPDQAARIGMLAQTIQSAAADGKITFTEDLIIGMALAAVFSK